MDRTGHPCWCGTDQRWLCLTYLFQGMLFLTIYPFSSASLINNISTLCFLFFRHSLLVQDSYNHVILGVQNIQVAAFANQITLSHKNMWGILKFFFDMFAKLDTGKYVLVKDPNRVCLSCLFLYFQSDKANFKK